MKEKKYNTLCAILEMGVIIVDSSEFNKIVEKYTDMSCHYTPICLRRPQLPAGAKYPLHKSNGFVQEVYFALSRRGLFILLYLANFALIQKVSALIGGHKSIQRIAADNLLTTYQKHRQLAPLNELAHSISSDSADFSGFVNRHTYFRCARFVRLPIYIAICNFYIIIILKIISFVNSYCNLT